MSASQLTDFRRLCVHTITTKPWSIEEACDRYAASGVPGITVWRQWLEGRDVVAVGQRLRSAGLRVVSVARGGFFPAADAAGLQAAIDDNRRAIDQAAGLEAPLLVLVCGAEPSQSLRRSRQQIADGIGAVLDHAKACGVKLGIEPLHPMYADTRSAINTLAQANDMCQQLDDPQVGVVVDVYHLWWDPNLEAEIRRCGQMDRLFAFHVCDWRTPTEDFLNDRGLMGEGCIDVPQIRSWVEATGFDGFIEVEIFSDRYWAMDQQQFLDQIKQAYLKHT